MNLRPFLNHTNYFYTFFIFCICIENYVLLFIPIYDLPPLFHVVGLIFSSAERLEGEVRSCWRSFFFSNFAKKKSKTRSGFRKLLEMLLTPQFQPKLPTWVALNRCSYTKSWLVSIHGHKRISEVIGRGDKGTMEGVMYYTWWEPWN